MNTRKPADTSAVDQIWRFFASVRLSVVLLLSLAVTSVFGTVIPQNADPAEYQHKYGPVFYAVFDALNLFDMYHSWWFRLLLCLLIANLVVCSIQRLSSTWKVIFPKTPKYQPERFRKSAGRLEWPVQGASPEDLEKIYEPYMRKHFTNIRVENRESGEGFLIFGEKGRWTRLGVYGVHFSVLLLMLGGLIGSIFGFEGNMNVPEGETRQTFSLKTAEQNRKLDFAIRCDDFTVSHYPSGRPREFKSDIAIVENGEVVMERKLRVNDPIKYRGIKIFQSTYGEIPAEKFSLQFTDKDSGMQFQKEAAIGEPIKMPGDSGTLVIQKYESNFAFRGHNFGPAYMGRIDRPGEKAMPVVLALKVPNFDKMLHEMGFRRGDYWISVKDAEFRQYTGLQITRNPGIPLVYAGFAIMILGCYVTFFMYHRKMCIELIPENQGTRIAVAGISTRNRAAVKNAAKKLAGRLEKMSPARQSA
ncbi:MAG: cytochrome c biogenesis protein ResB [Desulfobacterales bacterium]